MDAEPGGLELQAAVREDSQELTLNLWSNGHHLHSEFPEILYLFSFSAGRGSSSSLAAQCGERPKGGPGAEAKQVL